MAEGFWLDALSRVGGLFASDVPEYVPTDHRKFADGDISNEDVYFDKIREYLQRSPGSEQDVYRYFHTLYDTWYFQPIVKNSTVVQQPLLSGPTVQMVVEGWSKEIIKCLEKGGTKNFYVESISGWRWNGAFDKAKNTFDMMTRVSTSLLKVQDETSKTPILDRMSNARSTILVPIDRYFEGNDIRPYFGSYDPEKRAEIEKALDAQDQEKAAAEADPYYQIKKALKYVAIGGGLFLLAMVVFGD